MSSITASLEEELAETEEEPAEADDEITAQDKVFTVLCAFGRLAGEAHRLAEITKESGLDRYTVLRSMKAGCKLGIFEKVGHGRYRLGAALAMLGMQTTTACTPDPIAVDAVLKSLSQKTDGLTSYYSASGNHRFCLDFVPSQRYKMQRDWLEMVHLSRSLRTCASGRVILAHVPPYIRTKVLKEPVPDGAGPGTLDSASLEASLEGIRRRGYAIGREECVENWDSIAAPVLLGDLICGAALLRLPSKAMPADLTPLIRATVTAAAELSLLCAER
ncbi:IclR family transcriptional regulator domain-containing protein [Streptomyces syringium]|uniref:IclR family transcriptional regulator domain-containing protein n=1 Tax=Streptomyces syringium TaxID=76729 RepID=UPI003D8F3744